MFLFSADGRLLIQQRQLSKDVCPGAWDLSVAEHLQSGESYVAAAVRGLREELGVDRVELQPIGALTKSRLELAAAGIRDYEMQQSFRGDFDGPVHPNAAEVRATRLVTLAQLRRDFVNRPATYTPWFRARVEELGIL